MAAERSLTRPAVWTERARAAVGSPARAAVLAVAGLLVVSLGVRIWLSGLIATPWIMVDELLYSEMAKSFSSSGHFLIRDAPAGIVSVAYPALISPAWRLHPMSTTYGVAKAINVVLMTAAVVPLFLWARRLVSPFHAVVAVALTLLMPSFIYTGMLMTENAFLPAFLLAALVFALALERPTLLRQALAFGAILLASLVRLQGLVLVGVLPTAILLKVVFELRAEPRVRSLRFIGSELRRYWATGALLAAGALAYVLREVALGRPLRSGLGSYATVANGGYSVGEVRHWVLLHFAELPMSVGILPACALLLLLGLALTRGGTRSEAERAFVAVAVASVAWIVVEVAAFASRFSFRVEERYMFFLAPLLFLALALWLDRGLPRPPATTALAAAVPVVLLFALPLGKLLNVSIYSDTFGLIPFYRLSQLLSGVPDARKFLLVGGIAAALLFAFWPRRALPSLVLPGAVAVFLVLSSYAVAGALRDYSRALRDSTGTQGSPSWIDRRIGSNGQAAFLFGTNSDLFQEEQRLWQTEFWNRSLGNVYNNSTTIEPASLAETAVRIPQGGGRFVDAAGNEVLAPFVAVAGPFQLDGRLAASRPPLTLYRTPGALRLAAASSGIFGDGWMGADASYGRYAPNGPPGRMTVTLSRTAWGGPDVPGHVQITFKPRAGVEQVRRWTIHRGRTRSFQFAAPAGPFGVAVHIAPTFSPSQFGLADTRQLGAQASFRFEPSG